MKTQGKQQSIRCISFSADTVRYIHLPWKGRFWSIGIIHWALRCGVRAADAYCICLSESAQRLAFSWTPCRISSNKYGNLSMRAKLLSSCFCLLHSLVKYHFSINRLIANNKIGAFSAGNYLLRHDHSENVSHVKIKHFQCAGSLLPPLLCLSVNICRRYDNSYSEIICAQ